MYQESSINDKLASTIGEMALGLNPKAGFSRISGSGESCSTAHIAFEETSIIPLEAITIPLITWTSS